MKHVRFDRGRIYQNLIGHQPRAILERHDAVGALAPRVFSLVLRLRVFRLRHHRRILFDDVDIEHFQDRGIGISQTHLKIVPVVTVRVETERRRVPDIILAVSHPRPADIRAPGAPDTEVHLRRVVPYRCRFFAGLEHAQHYPYAGGQTVARSGRTRMNAYRLASPVRRARKRGQPFDLDRNLFARDDDWLPELKRRSSDGAADVAKDGLGHAADSSFEVVEMRGVAMPGCGIVRPIPDASARRTISIASETSEIPIPIGLNSDRSVLPGRGRAAATIAEIGCTRVQSPPHVPSYQSMNSALS